MPPTTHARLLHWVDEIIALCQPAAVHWCDGSDEEYRSLTARMVAQGTLIALDPLKRPNSFLARTHPSDVARVEERTYICSTLKEDAGPTNNWADPAQMKALLRGKFNGAMRGRTMYVVPFSMAPIGSVVAKIGVEITDSPYVAASMRLMTHMGAAALAALGADGAFIPCLHSVGSPLSPGQRDVSWPCQGDPSQKYIVHFPDDPSIWSYGSGYGGNALLGKKCLALRIASRLARDEGWMAEHMLILHLTSPQSRDYYLAAAFPSACGKTNLAMLAPTLPGWTVRCLGDDIAWLHIGEDGRLHAVNPEAGFFGVVPGTSPRSNPAAIATIARDTIFTNVALTADGDVWWEGLTDIPPAGLVDWQGRPWSQGAAADGMVAPAAHPNARFTVAAERCPVIDPRWNDPQGVPISAILFGGRRPGVIPLVNQAFSWEHGVFLGATTGSETTSATLGTTGVLRRDPFAMLPFCGYHMGDYLRHWLEMGERLGSAAPKIFFVNWFRKGANGRYLWPGFGENVRVLKWITECVDGQAVTDVSPIGLLPAPGSLDVTGLDLPAQAMRELVEVDIVGWKREVTLIADYFRSLGERLPARLAGLDDELRARLDAPNGRSARASG
jgi:phosphoenolpyruvate carboxykinase (GTP)